MLNYIKRDKKLSFNHWRYRILHLYYGINPKTVEESKAPLFFYTHYCPLFHATNIFLLLLPLFLLLKVTHWAIGVVVAAAKRCEPLIDKVMDKFPEKEEPKVPLIKLKEQEIIEAIKEEPYIFDVLIHRTKWQDVSPVLDREQIRQLWKKWAPVYLEEKLLKAEEEKARKERAVFWVNLSRTLFKCIFYVLLTLLGLGVGYLTFNYTIPVLTFLWNSVLFFWNIDYGALFSQGWQALKIGLGIGTVVGLTLYAAINYAKYLPTGPFVTAGSILGSVFGGCWEGICLAAASVLEFIQTFYEENCPGIEIKENE